MNGTFFNETMDMRDIFGQSRAGGAALIGCCNGSGVTANDGGSPALPPDERNPFILRMVQIAVLCVLSLTVMFGMFFLGCNLMMRTESMINFLVKDRRPSRDVEAVIVGLN